MKNHKAEIQNFLKQQLISGNVTIDELHDMVQKFHDEIYKQGDAFSLNSTPVLMENTDSDNLEDSGNLFAPLHSMIKTFFDEKKPE